MFEPGRDPRGLVSSITRLTSVSHVFPVEKYRLIKERLEASGALSEC